MRRLLAAALLSIAAAPPARVYKSTSLEDLEDLAVELRRHVATLHVEVELPKDDPLGDTEREGYAIALDPHHLAALTFTVENAKRIRVRGPRERALEGRVAIYDKRRRVAIIRTEAPIEDAGLAAAAIAPRETRREGEDVFALVNTTAEANVMHGVLIYAGDDPEYGGHHRVDLKLARGMPVFDATARFVGYSRAAAFDRDQLMLVTPEMVAAARTSTASRAASKASPGDRSKPRSSEKPWWSK
jgi:hypothetical protein